MLVAELILQLAKCKPDTRVICYDPRYHLVSDIEKVWIEDDKSVTLEIKLQG